jgi:hypothetical protein
LPATAGQPSKRLVGFKKVDLMPGESRQVTVTVDAAASNHPLSYWVPLNNAAAPGWSQGNWQTASGDYTFHVGGSSADTPLQATVFVAGGGASPTPPSGPTPPAACATASPGDRWVCVNSGWLPPGHPGIPATPGPSPTPPSGPTPPTACATASPGDGWVCVNGGWLPPGHPGAAGVPGPAPSPGPSPNPPASCPTVRPAADWVCISGEWLPPDHPLAKGAGSGVQ